MTNQHLKNIRAALAGLDTEHGRDLAVMAAKWIEDADRPRVILHEVAVEALLEARPLAEITGPSEYRTAPQRRAWATAALLAAIMDMPAAYDRRADAIGHEARIRELEQALAKWQASATAAWRKAGHDVPFRDPKHSYRGRTPAWAAEAAG